MTDGNRGDGFLNRWSTRKRLATHPLPESAEASLADVAAENDLQSLTQVYENMKPKDASALFEEMSPEFAAGFLGLARRPSLSG